MLECIQVGQFLRMGVKIVNCMPDLMIRNHRWSMKPMTFYSLVFTFNVPVI
jgi:hypothetical protein